MVVDGTMLPLGNVTGYADDWKFGSVQNLEAADTPADIWAYGNDSTGANRAATKTFPSTASALYVTSESTADVAVGVTVTYLSSSGATATSTEITMTGQTPINFATGLDINRMEATSSTTAVGNIYGTVNNNFTAGIPDTPSEVIALIPATYGQTQQSMYTVPLAKTLVMRDLKITVSRASGAAGSATVTLKIMKSGQQSVVKREFFPTSSLPIDGGVDGTVCPALAQIVWRVETVSDADTNVSASWRYELIDD